MTLTRILRLIENEYIQMFPFSERKQIVIKYTVIGAIGGTIIETMIDYIKPGQYNSNSLGHFDFTKAGAAICFITGCFVEMPQHRQLRGVIQTPPAIIIPVQPFEINDERKDPQETKISLFNTKKSIPKKITFSERLDAVNYTQEIPQKFLCPITYQIMESPVIAADGHTYEEKAIKEWMKKRMTSPKENILLSNSNLIVNKDKRSEILEFVENIERNSRISINTVKIRNT